MPAEATGMKLVLLAGGLTFSNEWLQTHSINWRVPVATVLGAALASGLGKVSPTGAASLGVMAVLVASTTRLNGKSPIQQISSLVNSSSMRGKRTTTPGPRPGVV